MRRKEKAKTKNGRREKRKKVKNNTKDKTQRMEERPIKTKDNGETDRQEGKQSRQAPLEVAASEPVTPATKSTQPTGTRYLTETRTTGR